MKLTDIKIALLSQNSEKDRENAILQLGTMVLKLASRSIPGE